MSTLLRDAVSLHQQGQLSEAAAVYRHVLAENPRAAGVLNLLATIELQQGRLLPAVALFDRAVAIDPHSVAPHCNRGVALQDLSRFDEAIASYDRALAIRPDLPEVLNNRGVALRALRRFREALESYDRALVMQPAYAEAHNNRGNILRDINRYEEALSAYAHALKIRPNYVESRRNRADLLQETGRWDEALFELDRLLAQTPQDAAAHRARGVVLQQLMRYGEAVAALKQAILAKPNFAKAYNNLANVLAQQSETDQAIAQYEHALVAEPEFFEAHLNLGKVLFDCRRFDDAAQHFQCAGTIMPDCTEAYIRAGEALLEAGRREEAIAAACTAGRLAQQDGFSNYALGVLFARCSDFEAAERHLLIALEQDTSDTYGARMVLAKIGRGAIPNRTSDAQLQRIYQDRSQHWTGRGYRGHELVADAIQQLCGPADALDIFDAGCGTGLAGERLRALARRLGGVDLSIPMLDAARRKGIYDDLHQADFLEFLNNHPQRYDVIAAAAVLIHFGQLEPVLTAAHEALRPQGLFVFTFFPAENADRPFIIGPLGGLAEGGCFLHDPHYIRTLAAETGFEIAVMKTGVHEHDNHGRPVPGQVTALRKIAG